MIMLTRLNGLPVTVNIDLVETVEATPDTVITFATGKKLLVAEDIATVIERAVEYKRKIHQFSNQMIKDD